MNWENAVKRRFYRIKVDDRNINKFIENTKINYINKNRES